MTKQELADLGLTPDDVLNKLVDRLFDHYSETEDGYKCDFENRMERDIKERIDERIKTAFETHVLPLVTEKVDTICLTETNRWGEKVGKPITFIEYLVSRVDFYIREEVNHAGKTKAQESYSWSKSGTRISYMIHEHLQYNISRAVETALGNVNSSVRKGLEEAVKIALDKIKVTVDTKVKTD